MPALAEPSVPEWPGGFLVFPYTFHLTDSLGATHEPGIV